MDISILHEIVALMRLQYTRVWMNERIIEIHLRLNDVKRIAMQYISTYKYTYNISVSGFTHLTVINYTDFI